MVEEVDVHHRHVLVLEATLVSVPRFSVPLLEGFQFLQDNLVQDDQDVDLHRFDMGCNEAFVDTQNQCDPEDHLHRICIAPISVSPLQVHWMKSVLHTDVAVEELALPSLESSG